MSFETGGNFDLGGGIDLGGGVDVLGNIGSDLPGYNFSVRLNPGKGGTAYIPVVYGEMEVAGILVAPPFATGFFAWMVYKIVLCEGEIESIDSILINDIDSTDPQYAGLVYTDYRPGTDAQTAMTEPAPYEVSDWTTDHKLSGFACVHIRVKRTSDLFKDPPSFKFKVKGKKCYDPRTTVTEYTQNPMLHALDYLTSDRYGRGATVVDYTRWNIAANYCDELITEYTGGPTITRFEGNFFIDTASPLKKNLSKILAICDGRIIPSGSAFAAYIEQPGDTQFSLNSDLFTGGMKLKPGSKKNRLNKAEVTYTNPDTDGSDLQVFQSDTLKTADGGVELAVEAKLEGERNKYRALNYAETLVKKSRDNARFSVSVGMQALPVEVGDICDITYDPYGITDKLARVSEKSINMKTGDINLTLVEHFDSFFDRDIPAEQPTPADTGIANPAIALDAVANLATTTGDAIFANYDTASILVEWDALDATFLNGYEIEYIASGEHIVVPIPSQTRFLISPATIGVSYEINVYAMNTLGMRGAIATSIIVAAGEDTPATPTILTADSGDSQLLIQGNGNILTRVRLEWTSDTPRNGFEIQYKKASAGNYTNASATTDPATRDEFLLGLEETVAYNIQIRALNKSTQSGWLGLPLELPHTVVGKSAPPPDVDSMSLTVASDGTRVFDGVYSNKPVDFAGYQIRYVSSTAGTWGSMTDLTTDLVPAFPHETNDLSAGTYTFAVKAVDTTGNSSEEIYFEQYIPDPRIGNVLESVDVKIGGYTGIKTNCSVDPDGVLRSNDKNTTTWADLGTWASLGAWSDDPELSIVYEHDAIDAGVITTFIPAVSHPGSVGTIAVEESHSDDNITYTSFDAVGAAITARYVKIRISITHSSNCVLDNLSVRLEADEVSETNQDEDTSLLSVEGSGGIRLPLTETYAKINNIYITIHGSGANIYWSMVDKNAASGPWIIFKNSSGTTVYPIIDYRIEGL